MSPHAPQPAHIPTEPSFETSLEEIESIIERIERGEVGLEESLKQYERGVELIGRCRRFLAQAELRVEDLTRKMQAEAERGCEGESAG